MKGILNLGNTCSISALLQCLFHSQTVVKCLHDGNDTVLGELLQKYKDPNHSIALCCSALFHEMSHVWYIGVQHDVCEAWLQLFEYIGKKTHSESHKREYMVHAARFIQRSQCPRPYATFVIRAAETITYINKDTASTWTDVFQGMYVFQTQCNRCGHIAHTFEPFSMLSLDITSTDLVSCLEHTMRTETIEGWECEKCKMRSHVQRHVRFWDVPKVLCISLKRFTYDGQKIYENIAVPLSFSVTEQSILGPQCGSYVKYHLNGTAIHHGNAYGGHYTALVKDTSNTWWHADDCTVQRLDHVSGSLISQSYFLLYDSEEVSL